MNTELSRLLINCIVMLVIPTVLAEIRRFVASSQIAGPAHRPLGPYGQTGRKGISQPLEQIEATLVVLSK